MCNDGKICWVMPEDAVTFPLPDGCKDIEEHIAHLLEEQRWEAEGGHT